MSRLPDRGPRPDAAEHRRFRLKNWQIALIAIAIVIVGPYLAFTKHIPFTGHGYTLNAVFRDSSNISVNSPVRIAGVNVGKVISVGSDGNNAKVTFTVAGSGQPVSSDAFAEIRPRIFLEGNFFVDLDPGSPSASKLSSGSTIPITHTSTAVQLDQILTAFQSPVRADFGRALRGFGIALTHQPTAAEDATQDPLVKGVTGAGGLNLALKYGGPAGAATAQVTNAFLGTEPHDLSRLVAGAGRTFGAFSANELKLQDLVVNFDTFTGALASQSTSLAATVHDLGPTLKTAHSSLVHLNTALPPLRTWAREFTPAVAELPATIATGEPWLAQANPLLSGKEAGGIAKMLAPTAKGFAAATQSGLDTVSQVNQLTLCASKVLIPTGNQVIDDQFSLGQPNYKEFFYSTADLAGESQNFDGNGPFISLLAGGGSQLVSTPNPTGNPPMPPNNASDQVLFGNAVATPLGTQPVVVANETILQPNGNTKTTTNAPPTKPGVKCYKQPVPDVNALGVGAPSPAVVP
jgi:phospholipid/cholesterol/gamma-HCH transport system substrate-binding protein